MYTTDYSKLAELDCTINKTQSRSFHTTTVVHTLSESLFEPCKR